MAKIEIRTEKVDDSTAKITKESIITLDELKRRKTRIENRIEKLNVFLTRFDLTGDEATARLDKYHVDLQNSELHITEMETLGIRESGKMVDDKTGLLVDITLKGDTVE